MVHYIDMNQPPRSEPYTDTILLDCSRATSEEVKGDPTNEHNAIFTNKLGSGVKLNPGDKVSVSSAFVSERGCGGSVIEFKGEPVIGQTYELTYTEQVKSQFPRLNGRPLDPTWADPYGFTQNTYPDNPEPFGDIGPMNCHQVEHKRTTKTYPLKDNEVNLEISFYKTTNGEGYVHLPRRWDFTSAELKSNSQEQKTGDIPDKLTIRDPYRLNPEALGQSALSEERTKTETTSEAGGVVNYDCAKNGRACISPNQRHTCPADWYIHKGLNNIGRQKIKNIPLDAVVDSLYGPSVTGPCIPYAGGSWDVGPERGGDHKEDYLYAPDTFRQLTQDGTALNDFIMKQKNDNSRYTIYAKDICHYAEHICDIGGAPNAATNLPTPLYEMPTDVGTPDDPGKGKRYGSPYASRDDFLGNSDPPPGGTIGVNSVSGNKEPSLSGYTRYTEIKNLKVPKGFNAPSNVAETLTNQLNATRDQRTIKGWQGAWLAPFDTASLTAEENARSTYADQRRHNLLSEYQSFTQDEPGWANPIMNGSTLQTTQRQIPVSTILESETLRSFACGNFNTFSRENFVGYRGQDPMLVSDTKLSGVGSGTHPLGQFNDIFPYPDQPTTNSVAIKSTGANIPNPGDPSGELGEQANQASTWDITAHTYGKEVKTNDVMNIQYLSNYQYLGVKRPELFDAIREFYRDDIEGDNAEETAYSWRNLNAPQCLTGMPWAFRGSCPFITTIEWTPANLLKVKAVFDAQAKYPELFTGYAHSNIELNDSEYKSENGGSGVSVDYMRFIHINTFNGYYPTIRGNSAPAGGTPIGSYDSYYYYKSDSGRVQLGDDNMNQPLTDGDAPNQSGGGKWNKLNPSRNAQDFSSSPLFVWYNDVDKDVTDNDGDQHKGLAYGTMWKYTSGAEFFDGFPLNPDVATATAGKSYIAFNTKKIGGIADFIFSNMNNDFWTFGGAGGEPVAGKGKGIPYPIGAEFGPEIVSSRAGRGCGFDIHFNAYGTSCIALYSGYLAGDKYAVETLKPGVNLPKGVKGEYYYDRGCCLPTDLALDPFPYELNFNPFGTSDKVDDSTTIDAAHAKAAYAPIAPAPPTFCINNEYVSHLPVSERMITAESGGNKYTISGKVSMPSGVDVWIHNVLDGAQTYGNRNISKFIRERYVGANSPLLAFDDKGERFNFQQLHTPLYVGNEANAGDGLTSVAETGGTAVVEINRRLLGNDFSPEMMPYATPIQPTKVSTSADDKTPPIQPMNLNLIPWQLYDSDGGIFLENFGLSEAQWKLSLWGVLGFSYDQFNTETNNRQTRINNIVEGSAGGSLTTNANLEASDVVKFRGNRYGTSLYTNQPPIASVLGDYDNAVAQSNVDYPVISIDQASAQVSAQNLPRKMLRPYFLIKSNIIGDMNYFGGGDSGQNLPIVCVINKENGFGDFYFQKGFDLEFTITHPKILTSVTTSIHDPDMSLSNVSGDSAVIFKITKQNNANLDVVQDVLQEQNNVMMRHAEALRVAQEEAIREQVRNGVDISDIDGVAAGAGDDIMMPVAPPDFAPALPPGQVVAPFTQALAGMAPPPEPRGVMPNFGGNPPNVGRVETEFGLRRPGLTPDELANYTTGSIPDKPPPSPEDLPPGTPILPQGQQAVEQIEDSGAPIGVNIPPGPTYSQDFLRQAVAASAPHPQQQEVEQKLETIRSEHLEGQRPAGRGRGRKKGPRHHPYGRGGGRGGGRGAWKQRKKEKRAAAREAEKTPEQRAEEARMREEAGERQRQGEERERQRKQREPEPEPDR
jgi:hypothetical protein